MKSPIEFLESLESAFYSAYDARAKILALRRVLLLEEGFETIAHCSDLEPGGWREAADVIGVYLEDARWKAPECMAPDVFQPIFRLAFSKDQLSALGVSCG